MRFAKYILLYVGGMAGAYFVWNGVRQQSVFFDTAANFLAASFVLILTLAAFVEILRSEIVTDVCRRLRTGGSNCATPTPADGAAGAGD